MNTYIDPQEVADYFSRKLVHWEEYAKAFAYAWNAGEHIVLHGPGGYGKSDGALLFHSYLTDKGILSKDSLFVESFNSASDEDALFGAIDIKAYTEGQGKHNRIQDSFLVKEFAVFEEFFDAPTDVLLALKDPLQSKVFRQNGVEHPVKTKFIVICTNRSYEEVVSDDSSAALLERFVFDCEVKWPTHKSSDYSALYKRVFAKSPLRDVRAIQYCSEIASKSELSPRTAVKMYKSLVLNKLQYRAAIMRGVDKDEARKKAFMLKGDHFKAAVAWMQLIDEDFNETLNHAVAIGEMVKVWRNVPLMGLKDYEVKDLYQYFIRTFSRMKQVGIPDPKLKLIISRDPSLLIKHEGDVEAALKEIPDEA